MNNHQYKYAELKAMKEEFESALLRKDFKDLAFYEQIKTIMQAYRANRFAYDLNEEELGVVKNIYRLAVQITNKLEGK